MVKTQTGLLGIVQVQVENRLKLVEEKVQNYQRLLLLVILPLLLGASSGCATTLCTSAR